MRLFGLMIFLFSTCFLSAQLAEVVHWTASYDEETNSIKINAEMDDDWVIYSQHTDPEGPIPLDFGFATIDPIKTSGEVIELDKPTVVMSEMFGVEVMKFKEKASFEQLLDKEANAGTLTINVTYMTCDSKRCLPPTTVPLHVKCGS